MLYSCMFRPPVLAPIIGLLIILIVPASADAHRPYFEDDDLKPEKPWLIPDPIISTAFYGSLDSSEDVDYFVFDGEADQNILLEITIPQIEGQANFAPTFLVTGPGLEQGTIPQPVDITLAAQHGSIIVTPSDDAPEPFFEPFSGTSYWQRQGRRIKLPADGRYTVAVWHTRGEVGRYVFVIGDKERPGGDPLFPVKMKQYWTPVPSTTAVQTQERPIVWWDYIARLLGLRN